MTEARPVLPTDLIALVSSSGRGYRNEAWTRERIGSDEPANALGLVKDQMLAFARGRQAWICVRRQRVLGLSGARRRGSRQAWEIDCLIDVTRSQEAVLPLLECAIAEVGSLGAEKLFLRLSAEASLLPAVRQAGFVPYLEEVLYAGRVGAHPTGVSNGLRPAVPSDSYLLYRFYNEVTPAETRRSEAATFNEWHAAQERHWLRNGVHLVQERDGRLVATARASRLSQGALVDLAVGDAGLAEIEGVVTAAVAAVEALDQPVFILVPKTSSSLALRLEANGFEPKEEFVSLVRRTTRTQALPKKLLPAIAAKTVVGA